MSFIRPKAISGCSIILDSDREPDNLSQQSFESQEILPIFEKLGYSAKNGYSSQHISFPGTKMSFCRSYTIQHSVFYFGGG